MKGKPGGRALDWLEGRPGLCRGEMLVEVWQANGRGERPGKTAAVKGMLALECVHMRERCCMITFECLRRCGDGCRDLIVGFQLRLPSQSEFVAAAAGLRAQGDVAAGGRRIRALPLATKGHACTLVHFAKGC